MQIAESAWQMQTVRGHIAALEQCARAMSSRQYAALTEVFRELYIALDELQVTQKALARSERELADFFENGPVGLYWVGADGRILRANQTELDILGYTRDEYVGHHIAEFHVDREIIEDILRRLTRSETLHNYEARLRARDGTIKYVLINSNVFWEDGQFVHTRCFTRDITERKRAEESLQFLSEASSVLTASLDYHDTLERVLQLTVPALADWCLLHLIEDDGPARQMVAHIDPEKEELLREFHGGCPLDPRCLSGAQDEQFAAHPELYPTIPESMLKAMARDSRQCELLRKVGVTSMLHVPLMARGRAIGALTLGAGPSGRRYTQADLVLAQELARRAALAIDNASLYSKAQDEIATRKKLQVQLVLSQKMESIGRLAGGVAHDFNNLLTAISGNAELALGMLEPSHPVREDLKAIEDAAGRAASLTRQLLAFARKQIIEPHVLNLNDLVLDMDKLLRRLIGADIELVTLPAPDLANVKVDLSQIEQVLVNLVVNARDAMPIGGQLTIETGNVLLDESYVRSYVNMAPGHYIVLAVSDTGVGMSPEVQARLFEPFFTTKDPGKGTGLGLATSYGIVRQHGGHICVYSEIGHGTTIRVYLPRTEDVAAAPARHDVSKDMPQGAETVLLVEDEPAVRALAARSLRALGYTVIEAGDGVQALKVATEHAGTIQLLLTDVIMPQMGGKALADWVVRTRPGIRVLFMSGYTDNAITQHGRLDPGIVFLQKPFSPAALAQKVREILDS